MKYLVYGLIAVMMSLQLPPGTPNPNGEPPEYPTGWTCTPQGINKNGRQTNEDPCQCMRVDTDQNCEGTPAPKRECNQWCHEVGKQKPDGTVSDGHCGCPVTCDPHQNVDPSTLEPC